MTRLRHTFIATTLAAAAFAGGSSILATAPAQAATDSWTKWLQSDPTDNEAWVRSFVADGTTIYAGTEDTGIYRSESNGVSWTRFSAGLDQVPGGKNVRQLFKDGGTIYAGTSAGVFKLSGSSWQPLAQGAEPEAGKKTRLNRGVQAFAKSGGTLLAGVHSGGVYRSGDGGEKWTPPAPGNGMPLSETVWGLTTHPATPNIVLAATSGGVYRSEDGGTTWALKSDGIPFVNTLRVVVDTILPNTYYVSTGGAGVYRSLDLGESWHPINKNLGGLTVRGVFQVPGLPGVLYAATEKGLYATKNAGAGDYLTPSWRHVTNNGLGPSSEMWAITDFFTLPATLVAGTHGNGGGGFHIQMTPPVNTSAPVIAAPDGLRWGKTISVSDGTWSGTPDITHEYRWEYKIGNGAWTKIANEDENTLVIPKAANGGVIRAWVEADNPFPDIPSQPIEKESAPTGTIIAPLGAIPGSTSAPAPKIVNKVFGNDGFPQPGDSMELQPEGFNPLPSGQGSGYKFLWFRCETNTAQNETCVEIPGETASKYTFKAADVRKFIKGKVIGFNQYGETLSQMSDTPNVVFPPSPVNVVAPSVSTNAWLGETMTGNTGQWNDPNMRITKRWWICNGEGKSCSAIDNPKETGSSYNVRKDDVDETLLLAVTADPNENNIFPNPITVYSSPSPVVLKSNPNPLPEDPVATPTPSPSPSPSPSASPSATATPSPTPTATPKGGGEVDAAKPVVSGLAFPAKKLKAGAKGKAFTLTVSESSTVTVTIAKVGKGRLKSGKCVKATKKLRKNAKCALLSKVGTLQQSGAGKLAIPFTAKFGSKKLAVGTYRATVVAKDAAGNVSAARTVDFKVVKK